MCFMKKMIKRSLTSSLFPQLIIYDADFNILDILKSGDNIISGHKKQYKAFWQV